MPASRRSLRGRFSSRPLLALSASCLWACPQLLSDEFSQLNSPGLGDPDPSVLDGSGGNGTSDGSGATGGPDLPPPANAPGAPAVVNVSPSDGATGVAANAVVTLTFSEPMSTSAVEGAYASSDLPPAAVRFSWSEADTVLQIAPNQPLSLATGSNPDTTVARRYAFELGTAAEDRDGEALPRFSASFTTLRQLSQTLDAVQDRSLTGNWRSDDVYGDNSCQFADSTTTCIGDSSNANSSYRGFVSFDLSDLPAELQELSAAQLGMSVDDIRFTPFPDLGNLVVERVSFDSISLQAFDAVALSPTIQISSSAGVGAHLAADVLAAVREDLSARGRSQFRFRFSTDTDSDDTGDLVQVLSTTEQLAVTYLMP